MATPYITVEERDGALGTVAVGPRLLAVVGTATAGPLNSPRLITKIPQLESTYTGGALVEACGELIARGVRCVAVRAAADDLTAALEALELSAQRCTHLYYVGDVDDSIAATLDSFCENMLENQNRRMQWYGSLRMPLNGDLPETADDYEDAVALLAPGIVTKYGSVAAGALWTTSRVTGIQGLAPFCRFYVAQEMRLDLDENSAALEYPLPNCSAYDQDGNLREQILLENLEGGLADLKLVVPRTWPNRGTSIYVTAPYIKSAIGSDFILTHHRAVMNLGRVVGYDAFAAQLNKPVRVNKSDGKILEEDALRIEQTVQEALDIALLSKPYASGVTATVDRDANLISGAELELTVDIIPLVFTQALRLSIGFKNPALEVL